MEIPTSKIEALFESVEIYSKTTFELSRLKALETTTQVATSFVSRLSVIIIFSLFTIVLNIGIALLLGEMFGKFYYGFFIVAAFYFVAGVIMHFFFHKWIKKSVSDIIITQVLN